MNYRLAGGYLPDARPFYLEPDTISNRCQFVSSRASTRTTQVP
jgi:hypothetical protein